MNILCLVLARGGSKGVPRKNIKLMHGKPLMSYVIEEAKHSKKFSSIVVSSDDAEILNEAILLGVTPLLRPEELASDQASSIAAVQHALSLIPCDYVLLLNACCPLTKASDIIEAIELLKTGCDSVVSLVEDFSAHPSKICTLEGDKVKSDLSFHTGERQLLTKTYKRNTALYLAKREVIASGSFFGADTRGYVMPPERSHDINSQLDWDITEFLLRAHV